MSHSYKKPYKWHTKRSDEFTKRALRRKSHQQCHEIEIDFDPDRDYAEFHINDKEKSEFGTKMGFHPGELKVLISASDEPEFWKSHYDQMTRK